MAAAVDLKTVNIVSNNGNLVCENDIDVKCEYDPTDTFGLNFATEISYKQIFFQIAQFINHNNDNKNNNKGARYLEYPKLYLKNNNPKCNDKDNCSQCYNINNSNKNKKNVYSLCSTKRSQIGNQLFDIAQQRQCVTVSVVATAKQLCIPDKLLTYDNNSYTIKSNWFTNVYSLLQWQKEAANTLLHNLVYLSETEIDQNVFLYKFDTLVSLRLYLDELIEYLVIFYCCFDTKNWVSVFYPFIQVAIGTEYCTMMFAQTSRHTNTNIKQSLCGESLQSLINDQMLMSGKQIEYKQIVVQETKGISIFKRLLYQMHDTNVNSKIDVVNYNIKIPVNNNIVYGPFDLTHKIALKLQDTINHIKTQLIISKMTADNVYNDGNENNNDERLNQEETRNLSDHDNTTYQRSPSPGITNHDTPKVPSFIRLFMIKRIIDIYVKETANTNTYDDKLSTIKKLLNVFDYNDNINDMKMVLNILMRLSQINIKEYMKK